MADKTIVNYDELLNIQKKFGNEGEVISQLTAKLRQSVHNMQTEWIGAGSDAFFDEMEQKLIPSMQNLQEALLFSSKTVASISKIYRTAEEQCANHMKRIGGEGGEGDFGSGQFGDIGYTLARRYHILWGVHNRQGR